MNTDIAGLAVGVLALALSIADAVSTGRLMDRVKDAKPAATSPESEGGAAAEDPEIQALRSNLASLANELRGLQGGPITSEEQLVKVVDEHLAYRRRREAVHLFATRKKEIRLLSKDWASVQVRAFKLGEADAARVADIMKKLTEDWLALSATTGGEPGLEDKIEALIDGADRDILAVLPEAERKRYRRIPRGWSSGLVGDPSPK